MQDRKTADITVGEWLAELARLSDRNDDGASMRELARAWGIGIKAALERVRKLNDAGKIAVGFRQGRRVDGVAFRYPVYRLKEERGGHHRGRPQQRHR